ncbi:hypothetical protein, partial [Arthrobacter sp. PsM3]|uniref:hypothetical protein n=1 Tax=Arthrobacter sp. PsM3 TaxID=3030531 RepID=UPI00263A46DE
ANAWQPTSVPETADEDARAEDPVEFYSELPWRDADHALLFAAKLRDINHLVQSYLHLHL